MDPIPEQYRLRISVTDILYEQKLLSSSNCKDESRPSVALPRPRWKIKRHEHKRSHGDDTASNANMTLGKPIDVCALDFSRGQVQVATHYMWSDYCLIHIVGYDQWPHPFSSQIHLEDQSVSKLRIFMWFLHQNFILTKDNLAKRRWQKCINC
jgi:hypothetical protein